MPITTYIDRSAPGRESQGPLPTPGVLHVHDDLSDEVAQQHGAGSAAALLARELLDLVRRDDRVRVLTVEEQVALLLDRGDHTPFAMTLAIGAAGERVARQLNERTGWFPAVRRLDIRREEDDRGGYRLATAGSPLATQLGGLEATPCVAVVDDTLFSGLTMRSVLRSLPSQALARTRAFCLRGLAESLPSVESLCPISVGFRAKGRMLYDVSMINASGMVMRVGIRRVSRPPMAFFERPAWMRAWFPGHADEVIDACRRLNSVLEPGGDRPGGQPADGGTAEPR